MRCNTLSTIIITLALAVAHNVAAAGTLAIKRQQALSGVSFSATAPAAPDEARQGAAASEQAVLSFQAYGRTFRLELELNERLLENFGAAEQTRLVARIKPYRGRIVGNAQSWARINQAGDRLSGMIWDGKEVFIIDPEDEIASALAAPSERQSRRPLIYRLKDARINAHCALDAPGQSLTDYDALVRELRERVQALPGGTTAQDDIALPAATKELAVAVVADPLFVQANGSDPQAAVVARMNVVDGIFSNQVGVHLKLASVLPLSANGTLTATAASTLLSQFGNYSASGGFNNPGIAHLFTGRNLDGSTIGIAYLGSLCSKRYGVGVSQINGTGSAGALIVAHEMGHNFGAPHDNQSGSPCASTAGTFIMNPSINGSNSFSSCSLSRMSPVIAASACVTSGGGGGGTPTTSLSATPTSLAAGASVNVSWSGIASPSATDWIGLHTQGAASTSYIDWMYVSCSKTAGVARASGSCAFTIPSSLAAGTYQMQLHPANTYSVIASSAPITVTSGSGGGGTGTTTLNVTPSTLARGASATVSWSDIGQPGTTNWIGLYKQGASAQQYLAWIYVSCSQTAGAVRASGSCTFPIPSSITPGTHEMRLFTPNGYTAIANSSSFTVQ